MGSEAFICCYFDEDDRDCVGMHILCTLVHLDFSHKMRFCRDFSLNFSWETQTKIIYVSITHL
jgi:hypothetical protein